MATSTLQLVVETNTRQLDGLVSKFKKTEGQLERLQGKLRTGLARGFKAAGNAGQEAARKISNGFKRAAGAAERFQKKLGGVRTTLLGLGVGAAAGFAVKTAASFEQTQLRLQLLSKEYGEFDRIQKLVAQNAETFNQSQRESAENFANVYARLRPLGKTLTEIQTTYEGFNAVAIASGASAQEASSAFLQLSQALGSGRLQGDEFRSISEQVPGILKLVSDELGVTVGELKKLGSEGKITSDVLINALAKGFDQNKDAIAELIALSPAQKFKAFQNSVDELSVAVGQELLPVLIPLVQAATSLLEQFGKLPGPIKTAAVGAAALAASLVLLAPALPVIKGIAVAVAGIGVAGAVVAGKFVLIAAAVAGVVVAIKKLYDAWEPFRRAVFAAQEFFRGFNVSIRQDFEETTQIWSERIQAFQKFFTDAWQKIVDFFKGIGQFFVDIWGQVVQYFGDELGVIGQYFSQVWSKVVEIFGQVVETLKSQWRNFIEFIVNTAAGPVGIALKAAGINIGESVANGIANGLGALKGGLPQISIPSFGGGEAPSLGSSSSSLPSGGGTGAGRSGGGGAAKRVKAEEDINEKLRERQALLRSLADEQIEEVNRIEQTIAGYKQENQLLQLQLDKGQEFADTTREINRLVMEGVPFNEAYGLVTANQELQKLLEGTQELNQMQELAGSISQTLEGGIVGGLNAAIQALVSGADDLDEKLKQIAQGVLADIASQLIKAGISNLFQSIGGGGGGGLFAGLFANGGTIPSGQFGIVGEEGPEFAFSNSSGGTDIVPMGDAMARYSPSNGSNGAGSQSNGSNSGETSSGGSIDVSYSVERINSVNYVTEESFRTGLAAAAKQGAAGGYAKSMSSLKNNRSQRSKLGL